MRRCRERRKSGSIVTPPLAVPPSAVENLVAGGFLKSWDEENPEAVANAILLLLESLHRFDDSVTP
ncbi:hypothetical protein [Oricola sp.]|uniref:hypothetical protein n=1 Tax=Oricola sp. TaxID=1979950 RepID=UPI0025DFD036|nr:hypothetical protein [Oricola sp.]MCI5073957.1 hypothetical protein [Oricola sp.]